ncbi:MAG: SAM-dependent methyltransferase [Gammaproteobacteria bacterium]
MSNKLLPALALVVSSSVQAEKQAAPDVAHVPTPQPVVDRMLELARVAPDDLVYDLGSGDGRIVITAARDYGARGVGIDIDPQRIREARQNAREAGVADRVRFRQADLFEADLRPATVVTLYLLPSLNERLMPKLLDELQPGTPIVSHDFAMGDWRPQHAENMDGHMIYMWTVPAQE